MNTEQTAFEALEKYVRSHYPDMGQGEVQLIVKYHQGKPRNHRILIDRAIERGDDQKK